MAGHTIDINCYLFTKKKSLRTSTFLIFTIFGKNRSFIKYIGLLYVPYSILYHKRKERKKINRAFQMKDPILASHL